MGAEEGRKRSLFYCLITGRMCSVFPYEKERLTECVFDTNLYITLGSKYTLGHPAGLGLNCKMTQYDLPVNIIHKLERILYFSRLSLGVFCN